MIKKSNIYNDLKIDNENEIFEKIFSNDDLLIERITSNGQTTPDDKWYDQDKNEWVLLLKGNAVIEYDNGSKTELSKGDYLYIPANQKHRVAFTSDTEQTVWLAVHFK